MNVFSSYVCVNLGGRNVGVAKECLHTAQVGAAPKQVSRKGVSQPVGMDVSANAC